MNILVFIALSVVLMLLLMCLRRKRYGFSAIQSMLIVVYVALVGLFSTRLLYCIENGGWTGRSFFGAVLFLPLFLFPLTKVMAVSYHATTDFVSVAGLAMFAVMKYNCYVQDCCGGIVIGYTAENAPLYFPSQLVEVFATLGIIAVLLWLEHKGKTTRILYPFSMIVYGVCRFVLNWFRWDDSARILGMPKGNFWALLSVLIGTLWILMIRHHTLQQELKFYQQKEDASCQ